MRHMQAGPQIPIDRLPCHALPTPPSSRPPFAPPPMPAPIHIYPNSICQSKSPVTFPHKLAANCDLAKAPDKEIGCTISDASGGWPRGGLRGARCLSTMHFFSSVSTASVLLFVCLFVLFVNLSVCLSVGLQCVLSFGWILFWLPSSFLECHLDCLIISLDLCYAN